MMKGNALFIVGNHGSGKSHLIRQLEDVESFLNLTPKGTARIEVQNVALEVDCFTEHARKLLSETVKILVFDGRHVYLLCSPATYEKIKYQILSVLEEGEEVILNEQHDKQS